MNKKSGTSKDAAEKLVRGIKRKTRKQYSAEEKIRIVLAGLRGDAWILSPMYVYVRDVKITSPGFVAFMNFYDFHIAKDDNRSGTSRFRGRWFLMQPLSRPGLGLFDGIYLLPELQLVYDFKANEASLWVAPEIGKMLPWGAAYVKPGFGIENDEGSDRDFTFEIGFRYFF